MKKCLVLFFSIFLMVGFISAEEEEFYSWVKVPTVDDLPTVEEVAEKSELPDEEFYDKMEQETLEFITYLRNKVESVISAQP